MTCAWCEKTVEPKDAQDRNHLLFHARCMKLYEEYLRQIRQAVERELHRG